MVGPIGIWSIWEKTVAPCPPEVTALPIEPATAEALGASDDLEIRGLAQYAGPQSTGFAITECGKVVCACWYWYGERYARERAFWPLAETDAKLVQVTTASHARGRGLARRLIAESGAEMARRGFRHLYARIWIRHRASENAFRAAGWHRIAWVATFHLPLTGRPVRLQRKARPQRSPDAYLP